MKKMESRMETEWKSVEKSERESMSWQNTGFKKQERFV